VQNFHGGQGARAEFDGLDTLSFPSNCRVTAIEMFEIAVPVLIERKELIPDSGGAGKHRGGLGQRAVLRNRAKAPMSVYLASERVRHPCFGVVEGGAGAAGNVVRNGAPHFPKGKVVLGTGDRLEVRTPGGGGWGRPSERPVELVLEDLAEGLISERAAREIYGWKGAAE
jgi:N-methylhydantoinase B